MSDPRLAPEEPLMEQINRLIDGTGYSILRGWLALHGGASERIVREELTQLVRHFQDALSVRLRTVEQEKEKLKEYVRHSRLCPKWMSLDDVKCRCGLDDLLAAFLPSERTDK